MSVEITAYPAEHLPVELKWQVLSFMRVFWPEGFKGKFRLRNWISREDFHPLHFLLTEQTVVISHTEVLWKHLTHTGQTFKVYGLSAVFTFPDHQGQGFGTEIVEAATSHIRQIGDADVAMLWCEPDNRGFYEKCGWTYIESAQTMITEDEQYYLDAESLMMLFLSEHGKAYQAVFEHEPIFFGDTTW
jgi:GNAT superfamily N-acetyltransferase